MVIKILYISPHVDFYGADRSLFANLEYMNQRSIRPFVVVPRKGLLTNKLTQVNIPFLILPFRMWASGKKQKNGVVLWCLKDFVNWCLAVYLMVRLWRYHFNLIHTNDLVTDIGMKIASLLSIPHVMHCRALLREQFGIEFLKGEDSALHLVRDQSRYIICNSQTVYDRYIRYFDPSKTTVINSAIYSETILKENRSRTIHKEIHFLFLGRYEPAKDPMVAIRAVKLLKDRGYSGFTLSLCGHSNPWLSEDYAQTMNQYVLQHGLDRLVHIYGYDPDIEKKLGQYHVGLMCSPIEGIARIVIEFLVHGMPVIGTKSGGTLELIHHGENGYLFLPGDEADLADQMVRFIESSDLVVRLGQQARASVERRFSVEYTSEQLADIYRQCIVH
jgi:L-malate glycosyltransferase